MSPSGIVLVDKPSGWTSHDVVGRLRRLAGTRKVGHAGTLDPMATGVLVVGVGRATRLLGHLMLTEKEYTATIRLGQATTTDDAEGEILTEAPAGHLGPPGIAAAREAFVGDIEQIPSSVSAIKVDGQRAYARVRAGEDVALPARTVHVNRFDIGDVRAHGDLVDVDVAISCSSGTYVRALARDLGSSLGVGGHVTALRRTSVGPFTLDDAHTLDALAETFSILPIADAARIGFPTRTLSDAQSQDVRYGRTLSLPIDELVAVFAPDGEFLALYRPGDADAARPVAVFAESASSAR